MIYFLCVTLSHALYLLIYPLTWLSPHPVVSNTCSGILQSFQNKLGGGGGGGGGGWVDRPTAHTTKHCRIVFDLYWSLTGLITAIGGFQTFALIFICEYFRPQGRIKLFDLSGCLSHQFKRDCRPNVLVVWVLFWSLQRQSKRPSSPKFGQNGEVPNLWT